MANQYTAGAYMGVNPIAEDFGDDALKSYEIVMQQNAIKIAERKQKTAEAKAAQERLNTYFKDMDKYSAEALSIQPMDFDKGLVDHMVLENRNRIIEALRIIQDPMTSDADKIMARSRVQMLSKGAQDYINDRKNMVELIKSMSNVNTEDGWDSVLSLPAMDGLLRALHSAGTKGTKKNEDGSISAGDFITQRMGNGGVIITLKTADILGEDITGTYSEIAAKLASKMHKTVDLQKNLWDYAGKGVQSRAKEFYRNTSGGLIEIIKQNDWTEIDRMIGDDFDARFPDAKSLDKLSLPLRKAITEGVGYNSRDDVRRAYILAGRNKVKDETNVQLQNDPSYLNEYKKWQMTQKQSPTVPEEFLRQVQSLATGDPEAINLFVGRPIGLNVAGAKSGDAKLEDVKLNGNTLTLTVAGGFTPKDGKISSATQEYQFDLRNPEGQKVLINALAPGYNDGKNANQKVDVSILGNYYNPDVPIVSGEGGVLDKKTEEKLGAIEEELAGKKNLSTSSLKPILNDMKSELEKLGYDLDINGSWFGKWGDMEIAIRDDEGNQVLDITEKSGDKVAQRLRDFIRDLMGYSTASGNPEWLRRGVDARQTPVNVSYTQSSTQRGGNSGGVPKF